jgi:hypothetical protein
MQGVNMINMMLMASHALKVCWPAKGAPEGWHYRTYQNSTEIKASTTQGKNITH